MAARNAPIAYNTSKSQPPSWGSTGSKAPLPTSHTPVPVPAPPPKVDLTDGLSTNPVYKQFTSAQRDAAQLLLQTLQQWGLQSLAPDIVSFIQQGYSNDSISYLLSQTDAYKQRFAGNDIRIKNGLAPLSPADYLATERAYRQVLASSGLPNTFYDQHSDLAGLIGADISPTELQTRAKYAFQYSTTVDPAYRQAMLDYYGVDQAHIAAHFLDPNAAQASLDRQYAASNIDAAAMHNGLQASKQTAEKYADTGMDYQTALKGYNQVASVLTQDQNIASHFAGASYSQTQAENEFLGGSAIAARQRAFLEQEEQGLFAQNQGNDTRSLNTNSGGGY